MTREQLSALLREVQSGTLPVDAALRRLRTLPFEDLGFASLDHHRSIRQGFPEVLFCEGKTDAQILGIAKSLLRGKGPFLATRIGPRAARALCRLNRRARYVEAARVVAVAPAGRTRHGHVLIVTAGTADISVAEEARVDRGADQIEAGHHQDQADLPAIGEAAEPAGGGGPRAGFDGTGACRHAQFS